MHTRDDVLCVSLKHVALVWFLFKCFMLLDSLFFSTFHIVVSLVVLITFCSRYYFPGDQSLLDFCIFLLFSVLFFPWNLKPFINLSYNQSALNVCLVCLLLLFFRAVDIVVFNVCVSVCVCLPFNIENRILSMHFVKDRLQTCTDFLFFFFLLLSFLKV